MPWKQTTEDTLADTLVSHIDPFWKASVTTGEFIGKENVEVHFAYCIPPTATQCVVISSGRIESLLRYKEVIYDLYQNNFAVFILDHRGQGLSGRMTDIHHHGYVSDFDDYVEDFCHFLDHVVSPRFSGPRHLLCHSMGGAIGMLVLLKRQGYFSSAVLISPMFGIRPALPNWLANCLVQFGLFVNRLRRKRAAFFFGQGLYHAYPFAVNPLTHSEVRYKLFRQLYNDMPTLQLGGVTTEWLRAARHAMDVIAARAHEVTIPVLAFSADDDVIIDNKRQRSVINSMSNATLVVVPGARHELLMESDTIRRPVIDRLLDFITKTVH